MMEEKDTQIGLFPRYRYGFAWDWKEEVWENRDTIPTTRSEAFFYSRCLDVVNKRLLPLQVSVPEQQLGTKLIERASIYPSSGSVDLLLSSTLFTTPGLSSESLVFIEKELRAAFREEDFEVQLVTIVPVWGTMYLRVYLTDLKVLIEKTKNLNIKLVV